MTDTTPRRSALPPYDLALWFQAPALMLCLGAMVMLGLFRALGSNPFGIFIGAFFVGVVLMSVARLVRCPNCRKSLMVSYLGLKRSNPLRFIVFKNNFLPERICSDCGTRLDGSAATGQADGA